MPEPKRPRGDVFTTGEIAAVCRVASRTAAGWVDGGLLKGYRVPGTTHRRVLREHLEAFMSDNGMPAAWLADWLRANAPAITPTPTEATHAGVRE